MLDQFADIGLHVARRDAPRFSRKQHGLLTAFRYRCPELPIENLAVRFDQHPGFGHLVFMRAENLAQVFNLLVHAVEHLPDGVDFHFAALEALQSKADCQVLSKLHDHGLIGLRGRCLGRQAGQRLLQRVLRAARKLGHLLLKCSGSSDPALARSNLSETR